MGGVTPTYGWPYETILDQPDGPALGHDLALAIEASLAATDATAASLTTTVSTVVAESANTTLLTTGWTAWTPAWTAATTNPTLGNGTIQGRYKLVGKLCWFWFAITFGSTTSAGSGVYAFGLPPGIVTKTDTVGASTVGVGYRDNSAAVHTTGFGTYNNGASVMDGRVNGANQAGSSSPYTWASVDFIRAWGFVENT